MKYWKFLKTNFKSANGDCKWKLGEWQKYDGELEMCKSGFHCSKTIYQAFSYVQGEILAEVECKGKHLSEEDKECWAEMRIIRAWKWQKKDSVALAIYSAELVLKNYEKKYPNDMRSREAIEAAKKVLFKDTAKNRSAARSAARSAWSARSAAESAESAWSARSAAESAAESAWSAAESAWSAWSARSALINKISKFMNKQLLELEEISTPNTKEEVGG